MGSQKVCSRAHRSPLDENARPVILLLLFIYDIILQIRYSDFGNDDNVTFDDLTRCILFADTPTQMIVVSLDNIRPVNGKRWELAAIEFVTQLIRQKKCVLMVHDHNDSDMSAPIPATIRLDSEELDLATLLVNYKYAEKVPSYSKRERERSHLEEEKKRHQQPASPPRMIDSSNLFSNEHFKAYCAENLPKPVPLVARHSMVDDSVSVLNSFARPLAATERSSLVYKKTDNVTNRQLDTITAYFKYQPLNTKRFKCRVVRIVDPVTVLIVPEQVKPTQKPYANLKFSMTRETLPIKTPVVVWNQTLKVWQRGIIHEHFSLKEYHVLFVDTLDINRVSRSCVQACSSEILDLPLDYALVHFHGIAPNTRYRSVDLERMLRQIIDGCDDVFAIVKKTSDSVPVVKLVTDLSTKNLVYLEMIQNKMFKS